MKVIDQGKILKQMWVEIERTYTVVIGGILSSTLLTLVLLPVLYEWVEGRVAARSSRSQGP